jgi:rhamnose utilization protein RhaD (predicted bifunctional aldolase and dehydrogenase)
MNQPSAQAGGNVQTALQGLVAMSNTLGAPAFDAVILGEGNTSTRVDDKTFLVKGSGCQLQTMTAADFVQLRFDVLLELLAKDTVSEAELSATYEKSKVDPSQTRRPSVEALFHALCLQLPGVNFVAHSHATAVNGLTCGKLWPHSLQGRLFPDEAVVLGPDSVFVPYVDPGVILAKAIRDGIEDYRREYNAVPKVVYMQNHGVIALGANAGEALNITAMAIKAARIRATALQAGGGLAILDRATVAHLLGRPDEKYRQQALGLR